MSLETMNRPDVQPRPTNVTGLRGVGIVLRRELRTKLLTKAFAVSTLIFAVMMLAVPAITGNDKPDKLVIGYSAASTDAGAALRASAGAGVEVRALGSVEQARAQVQDSHVDAALVPRPGGGYQALVDRRLDAGVAALINQSLTERATTRLAQAHGVTAEELQSAHHLGAVPAVPVGEQIDAVLILVGLGFGAAAVVVTLLWAMPLTTDVMQEKVSRVVEILLTSIRPWQLLAGKIVAATLIGIVQLAVVAAAAYAGLRLFGTPVSLGGVTAKLIVVGVSCMLLGVMMCSSLMAGLAARVERQEDLGSVLQPAFIASLLPLTTATYGAFSFPDSRWFDIASMAPVFSVFVMPARMTVETVPDWQVGVALGVGILTVLACFLAAGRIYTGSVLRSGGRVSLRESWLRQ